MTTEITGPVSASRAQAGSTQLATVRHSVDGELFMARGNAFLPLWGNRVLGWCGVLLLICNLTVGD